MCDDNFEPFNYDWDDDRPGINYDDAALTDNFDVNDYQSSQDLVNKLSQGSSSETESSSPKKNDGKKRKTVKSADKEKERLEKKLERERLKEEKKAAALKQKEEKAALLQKQRSLKPEESIKNIRVEIDNNIINSVYGGSIIIALQQAEIQYNVGNQPSPFTISWDWVNTNESGGKSQLFYILNWQKAVELTLSKELLSHVEIVRSSFSNKSITLIIYDMEKYFNYQKIKTNRELKATATDKNPVKVKGQEREFENAGYVSRDDLEFLLTELQILGKCNHRFIETPEELSILIVQATKSLAQYTFKLEKQKRQEMELDWFAKADSKSSVKVDKNGNGLSNLWQQQLCQFNLVGLETAQAIVSNYNSPVSLVSEYKECFGVRQRENLLENIPIRRDAGILSSVRRVGPELSKKVYQFFNSDDPLLEL